MCSCPDARPPWLRHRLEDVRPRPRRSAISAPLNSPGASRVNSPGSTAHSSVFEGQKPIPTSITSRGHDSPSPHRSDPRSAGSFIVVSPAQAASATAVRIPREHGAVGLTPSLWVGRAP